MLVPVVGRLKCNVKCIRYGDGSGGWGLLISALADAEAFVRLKGGEDARDAASVGFRRLRMGTVPPILADACLKLLMSTSRLRAGM